MRNPCQASWPLEEHPGLREAVATMRPVLGSLDREAGPRFGRSRPRA